jgi:hypothetical protein
MKKYVCLIRQSGEGCDYTVGCGYKFFTIEAEDQDKAFEIVINKLSFAEYASGEADPSYYCKGGESEFAYWRLIEVTSEYDLLPELQGWQTAFNAEKMADSQTKKDAEDRAKYEELKRKFG